MKNKKGFIAISIIFSFFIVFLMLITLILTSYSQNRILMGQIKNDIKEDNNVSVTNDKSLEDTPLAPSGSITVTFDANDGTISNTSGFTITSGGKTATKILPDDTVYGTLPTPIKKGYTFNGWYTNTENGTQVTKDTKVTTASDHKLYAKWTANTYVVSFNLNFRPLSWVNILEGFDIHNFEPTDPIKYLDNQIIKIEIPYDKRYFEYYNFNDIQNVVCSRTNYEFCSAIKFDGWYAENGEKITPRTIMKNTSTNQRITARWMYKLNLVMDTDIEISESELQKFSSDYIWEEYIGNPYYNYNYPFSSARIYSTYLYCKIQYGQLPQPKHRFYNYDNKLYKWRDKNRQETSSLSTSIMNCDQFDGYLEYAWSNRNY